MVTDFRFSVKIRTKWTVCCYTQYISIIKNFFFQICVHILFFFNIVEFFISGDDDPVAWSTPPQQCNFANTTCTLLPNVEIIFLFSRSFFFCPVYRRNFVATVFSKICWKKPNHFRGFFVDFFSIFLVVGRQLGFCDTSYERNR